MPRVTVSVIPKASRQLVEWLSETEAKVWVHAAPEKGKANKALLKLLSKTWGVGMRSLRLIKGTKDRNKTVLVDDADGQTFQILCDWAQTLE